MISRFVAPKLFNSILPVLLDVRRVVGQNVRRYRLAANLSQEELADRMGVRQAYISELESGRRNPTVVTLWHAALALGVRASELLEDREPP